MGVLSALAVLFVWLKLGHAIDLSWWWIWLGPAYFLVDTIASELIKKIREDHRSVRVRRDPGWFV